MRVWKEFRFEAAHSLPFLPEGHNEVQENDRTEGHYTGAEVWESFDGFLVISAGVD